MKRIVLSFLFFSLSIFGLSVHAQQNTIVPSPATDVVWQQFSLAERYEELSALAKNLTVTVSDEGIAKAKTNWTFPFFGVGVVLVQDPETSRIQIRGVFKGSPADQAGIKVGDLIESINGHDLALVNVTSARDFIATIKVAVTLKLKRKNNGTFEVTMSKANIAAELKNFVDANFAQWREAWINERSVLLSFVATLEESKNNAQKLDECYVMLDNIAMRIFAPYEKLKTEQDKFTLH